MVVLSADHEKALVDLLNIIEMVHIHINAKYIAWLHFLQQALSNLFQPNECQLCSAVEFHCLSEQSHFSVLFEF